MFNLFENVRIKKNDLPCTIVDISEQNGIKTYIVESDIKGKRDDGYGGEYPLYWCKENEIEKINFEK